MSHPATMAEDDAKFRFRDAEQTSISLTGIKYASKVEVDEVIAILQDNPKIESIDLTQVNMSPRWLTSVIEAAATCPNLRSLWLAGNIMDAKGFDTLLDTLPRWPQLKELSCEGCGLEGKEIAALCETLEGKSLQRVVIGNNKLAGAGEAIASLIRNSPTLRRLDMQFGTLDDASYLTIAQAVCQTDRLVSADMHYNNESEAARGQYASLLSEHRVLNLVEPPSTHPDANAHCLRNFMSAKGHVRELVKGANPPALDFTRVACATLVSAQARMPALQHTFEKHRFASRFDAFQRFEGLAASLPAIDVATMSKEALFSADARGFTPLDNYATWQQIGEIASALSKQGNALSAGDLLKAGRDGKPFVLSGLAAAPEKVLPALNSQGICVSVDALLDGRQPTALLKHMIKDGSAHLLLSPANLQHESPQAVRCLYHALPESEQGKIPNLHSLIAGLGSNGQQAGRGR